MTYNIMLILPIILLCPTYTHDDIVVWTARIYVHNPFYWIIKTQCGNIIEIVKLVVFRARLGHAYIRFSTRVYIIYTRNTYTSVRP